MAASRQQMLAWGGFTNQMQEEADKVGDPVLEHTRARWRERGVGRLQEHTYTHTYTQAHSLTACTSTQTIQLIYITRLPASHTRSSCCPQALRLCSVGLLGKGKHCARHVVSTEDTKYTHTDAGLNVWEESQRELNVQRSVVPNGEGGIGTPGDFGDR